MTSARVEVKESIICDHSGVDTSQQLDKGNTEATL